MRLTTGSITTLGSGAGVVVGSALGAGSIVGGGTAGAGSTTGAGLASGVTATMVSMGFGAGSAGAGAGTCRVSKCAATKPYASAGVSILVHWSLTSISFTTAPLLRRPRML